MQFEALKHYLESGGNIMIMLGEGGEAKSGTNVNYFLEEFGMVVNSDSVVSTVFRGSQAGKEGAFVHPKVGVQWVFGMLNFFSVQEVLISDGVTNREINRAAGKKVSSSMSATSAKSEQRYPVFFSDLFCG